MATSITAKTKLILAYSGDLGTYTFSSIKNSATNENILSVASSLKELQKHNVASYHKVVEYELSE